MTSKREVVEGWAKFLNPLTLRANLLTASIFLTAYESLMQCIVDQLQGFYCTGFDPDGLTYSDSYRRNVLARHKEKLTASLLWFQESGAIDQADIDLVDRIRKHRNEIAHELWKFMATAKHNVDIKLIEEMCGLVVKIDRWWIRNIELDVNPDFDHMDKSAIPDDQIQSGRMIFLEMMIRIAAAEDDTTSLKFYHEVMAAVGEPVSVGE